MRFSSGTRFVLIAILAICVPYSAAVAQEKDRASAVRRFAGNGAARLENDEVYSALLSGAKRANHRASFAGDGATIEPQEQSPPPTPAEDELAPANRTEPPRNHLDQGLVSQGAAAFGQNCVSCHDAEKSLSKSKSLEAWRGTIQRMATKDGADIPSQDIEAIAIYLASQGGANGAASLNGGGAQDEAPSISIYGTLSPTWRGGDHDLQHPGFFPDVWVGAAWQGKSALSAKVTTCITCHGMEGGSNVDLVEASMRLDLMKAFNCCDTNVKSAVEAGRFVVPFGAFSKQVNPGVYRSVSRPLIYNMGQRVYEEALGAPVLPMPYSDQGISNSLGAPLGTDFDINWSAYAVNGLQSSTSGIDFETTRNNYMDNNTRPALGTRLTAGTSSLQFGGSFMTGQSSPSGGLGANNDSLYYQIFGGDISYRYKDIWRVQAEYARRDSDRIVSLPDDFRSRDRIDGYYVEQELLLLRQQRVSFYARYDHQHRASLVPPDGSDLTVGRFSVDRLTYGLNFVLPGGSLLMVNCEHWFLPEDLPNLNVLGARWAYTF